MVVAVGALLFAVLLLIVAAMVWQELRHAPEETAKTYVLEEVVAFAFARLSDDTAARIDRDDVRRILEWEVFYLQGLHRTRARADGWAAPVAGSPEAVQFVVERLAADGQVTHPGDVAEVLALEGAYLIEIGAVGPAVDGGAT